MPAPVRALLVVLTLLLLGGASAAAMPGDQAGHGAPTTDRATGKPVTAPGTTATTAAETTPETETVPTTPVEEDEDKPGRKDDHPNPPEHAQNDKPKLDGKADPPALGKTVVVNESRGAVLVRLPGTASDVALEHVEDVPVGSIIDTRKGAVVLRSAVDAAGKEQAAVFHGGRFEVRQAPDGYVDVHLRGRFGECPPRSGRARAATASRPRRPQRKLWGQDDHGRFRTHGRDAVATVRGTLWKVQEQCNGTKVSVGWGAVDVLDKRTGRTVRVGPGESHLARRTR